MTFDKMFIFEMTVDEMSFDKMTVDEMTVDDMTVNEMTFDKKNIDDMFVGKMSVNYLVDEMFVDEKKYTQQSPVSNCIFTPTIIRSSFIDKKLSLKSLLQIPRLQ